MTDLLVFSATDSDAEGDFLEKMVRCLSLDIQAGMIVGVCRYAIKGLSCHFPLSNSEINSKCV